MEPILGMAIGVIIIYLVFFAPHPPNDDEDHPPPGMEIYYRLSESGKAYIAEQIEIQAKDFCMDEGWHKAAEASANASDHFRRDVSVEIPQHLTLSGKTEIIKLYRSHFVRLAPPIIE